MSRMSKLDTIDGNFSRFHDMKILAHDVVELIHKAGEHSCNAGENPDYHGHSHLHPQPSAPRRSAQGTRYDAGAIG